MTAKFEGTRHYTATRDRIFHACVGVMQLSGLQITASDPETGSITAISSDSQFSLRSDSGFLEEVGVIMADLVGGVLSKFREHITVSIDQTGNVHAISVSRPRTVGHDYGRNGQHILAIWKGLDEVFSSARQGVSVKITDDHSVTITGNQGSVQNASPYAHQQVNSSAGRHNGKFDEVLQFLAEIQAKKDDLKLEPAESEELQAEMATIHAQAGSPNPKRHIIKESLHSIRTILEHAGGGVVAAGLLELLQHIRL